MRDGCCHEVALDLIRGYETKHSSLRKLAADASGDQEKVVAELAWLEAPIDQIWSSITCRGTSRMIWF